MQLSHVDLRVHILHFCDQVLAQIQLLQSFEVLQSLNVSDIVLSQVEHSKTVEKLHPGHSAK